LYLNSTAIDFADEEDLRFCWDIYSTIDSDDNGILIDDCDIEGQEFAFSWTISGVKTVTAIVWDDDNASDMFSIDVNVVNRPPVASITVIDGIYEITEGDSLTFSGVDSSDTSTDKGKLIYIWDDPATVGATQDGFGLNYTMKFDKPGTYSVNLTVTDDDGKSSTATVQIEVKAKPTESLFGLQNSSAIGYGMGFVIIILLAVLALRRRGNSDDYSKSETGMWDSMIQPQVEAPVTPPQPSSFGGGPQVPAMGLPPGWTMEQWQYYGDQYLQQNPQPATFQQSPPPVNPMASQSQPVETYSPPVVQQPVYNQQPSELSLDSLPRTMVQEPPPTPASQALADLLDDLDL